MREIKVQTKEHDEKMSVGWVYGGYCCPGCINRKRWNHRGMDNSKRKTLRSHRDGKKV